MTTRTFRVGCSSRRERGLRPSCSVTYCAGANERSNEEVRQPCKSAIKRKIPTVMFSQHPDNAGKPYWHTNAFIKTQDELLECYLMFKEFGDQEVMWDWEGKFVDEAVVERLLGEHLEFFRKHPLGKDTFLTFRVPNPRVESGYRLGRAFMVILSAGDLARKAGFKNPPLFEVILPMTESAAEIIELQKNYRRFSKAADFSFGQKRSSFKPLEVIPLFETVDTIMKSGKILKQYIARYKGEFGDTPPYLRPFCARSDPALNSGIVPTVLAVKWALSEYAKFTSETGIKTYPIIAPGALPFRGGFNPETVLEFVKEFKGVRTVMVQSAFRYDYPLGAVKKAIKSLIREVPRGKTEPLPEATRFEIEKIIPWFENPYRETVKVVAPLIEKISASVPPRRERMQHIGLFGYSRGIGNIRLPRAIGFTAACYSLGIPPELFGAGRGLARAKKEGKLKTLEALYKTLKPSLIRSGRYLRKESLKEFGLVGLEKDVALIEEYLGEKLGPKTESEREHEKLVACIVSSLRAGKSSSEEVEQAATIRRSLG
ncbi:MAG: phosphoenolpyruvate carboxylase [bacterium]|nr:phosphoenolpyruvate carboxylase [bacterium]